MKTISRTVSFDLVVCGLLLGLVGWLVHRAAPALAPRLSLVALIGGGLCVAIGLLACWRPVNLRWSACLLLAIAGVLGWQAWQAWQGYFARPGSYRPVPVVTTLLCLMTLFQSFLLWTAGRGQK